MHVITCVSLCIHAYLIVGYANWPSQNEENQFLMVCYGLIKERRMDPWQLGLQPIMASIKRRTEPGENSIEQLHILRYVYIYIYMYAMRTL